MPKIYAVRKGRQTGLFNDWPTCAAAVLGFAGAIHQAFPTEETARAWLEARAVLELPQVATTLYVDAGQNAQSGPEAWASVVTSSGQDALALWSQQSPTTFDDLVQREVELPVGRRRVVVAQFDRCNGKQHNGGELLALVCGLRIAELDRTIQTVASDSATALAWSQHCSSIAEAKFDSGKVDFIRELQRRTSDFRARGGQLVKISGDGNPADLGYH